MRHQTGAAVAAVDGVAPAPAGSSLAPGRRNGDDVLNARQSLTCTATMPAIAGQYTSEVVVYAWDNDGRRTTTMDPVNYLGML